MAVLSAVAFEPFFLDVGRAMITCSVFAISDGAFMADFAIRGDSMASFPGAVPTAGAASVYEDGIAIGRNRIHSKRTVNDLWAAFRTYDTNGDGSISFEELK